MILILIALLARRCGVVPLYHIWPKSQAENANKAGSFQNHAMDSLPSNRYGGGKIVFCVKKHWQGGSQALAL